MARRRHRRHGHTKSHSVGSMISRVVTPAAFAVSFVNQITQKDIDAYGRQRYNTLPAVEKAKALGNVILGRTISYNPFPQYGNYTFAPNPAMMINKYTGMGVGLLILGHVIPRGMGGKGLAKKVGKGLFWGGLIGGFLDPNTGGRASGMNAPGVVGSPGAAQAGGAGSRVGGFGGTMSN